ncbi:glutamate receptor ionotropic, delta-1-like [Gigantopelta aegis]|uniref:glutamate receptor ionotropic, delta-1-like n=1 Tax=Gigantopelta aegis TaxID=1735272 RepID=UPI001B88DFFB|nr:glutamate receptor ionotropic, delta-1-like [Gigantopelta aegis]
MGFCVWRLSVVVGLLVMVMITGVCSKYFQNKTFIHIVNIETTLHTTKDFKLESDTKIPFVNLTTLYTEGPPSFSFFSGAKKAVTNITDVVLVPRPQCSTFLEDSIELFDRVPVMCYDVCDVAKCVQKGNFIDICGSDGEDQSNVNCNAFGLVEDVTSTAVYSLVKHLKWKWLLIIFDAEHEQRARIIQTNTASNIYVLLFRVEQSIDLPSLRQTLHQYYSWTHEYKNVIVLCGSPTHVEQILHEANSFDDLHDNKTSMAMFSQWLFVTGEDSVGKDLSWILLNNVVMVTIPPVLPPVPGAIRETIQNTMKCLLDSQNRTFTELSLDTSLSSSDQFIQLLSKRCKCWEGKISSLLYTENGRELSKIGFFDFTGTIHVPTKLFTNEDFGFNGRVFRVGTMLWPPYLQLSSENNTKIYEGLCINLLEELAKIFNFSYEIGEVEENATSRGTVPGLVGAMIRGELDLIVAPMLVSADKELVIDFTFPFFHDVSVGVFRMPDPEKSKWLTLIKPFKWEVLACIGVSLVTSTILLTIIQMTQRLEKPGKLGEVFQSCLWYIYGALLSHGCSLDPATLSGRILVGFWWLFCLVISASYSGILIAFLTVERQTPPLHTLADLVAQEDYSWGTLGGTAMLDEYHKSTQTDIKALVRGLSQTGESMDEHKKRVLDGSYVFFGDRETLVTWTRQHCDLAILDESFSPFKFSVGLPKNSPYTDLFSKRIIDIQSGGLMEIWKKHWWPQRNLCVNLSNARNRPIQLSDLQSIFYVAIIGLVLASVILITEKLVHLYHYT